MYQLFVFFMITDPKTTVKSKKWQCVVVFCVALAELLLRLNQVVYAPLYALFLVGPAAMLIEIWLESRRSAGPSMRSVQRKVAGSVRSNFKCKTWIHSSFGTTRTTHRRYGTESMHSSLR